VPIIYKTVAVIIDAVGFFAVAGFPKIRPHVRLEIVLPIINPRIDNGNGYV